MESTKQVKSPDASALANKTPKVPSLLNPQTVIRIIVGKEKAEFFVHKDFLCFYSPYFVAALRDGAFKESKNQTIELDHTTPEAFGLFVSWIYTQSIPVIHGSKADKPAEKPADTATDKPSWAGLVNLWILSDYLQVPTLQNSVVDELLLKINRVLRHPEPRLYLDIYKNTGSGSVLRKLVVDLCVWRGFDDKNYYPENYQEFPKEMLGDIASGYALRHCRDPVTTSPLFSAANYHVKTTHSSK